MGSKKKKEEKRCGAVRCKRHVSCGPACHVNGRAIPTTGGLSRIGWWSIWACPVVEGEEDRGRGTETLESWTFN